jgi:hypothetical protein
MCALAVRCAATALSTVARERSGQRPELDMPASPQRESPGSRAQRLLLAAMPERGARAIVHPPSLAGNEGPNDEETRDDRRDVADVQFLVNAWRVKQLQRVGLLRILAEAVADLVDWHVLAKLIAHGCTPELAFEIVR